MSILPKASINPTDGLIKYIMDIKPYHTKILDIDVDYVYNDSIDVNIIDRHKLSMYKQNAITEVLRSCGWGIEWDPLRTIIDYPTVRIIRAYGQIHVEVIPTISSADLIISYNTDEYLFNIGDPILFFTTGTLPRLTVNESISPGLVYYITNIQDNVLTISSTQGGTPITFYDIGTGTITIYPTNIPYNTFDVEPEFAQPFYFVVSNIEHHQLTFVHNYSIIGVDILTRSWIVQGDHSTNQDIITGNTMFVRDNTGIGTNTTYTVVGVSFNGTDTVIDVVEPISIQATNNGYIGIIHNETTIPFALPSPQDATNYWPTPSWAIGTKVLVQSTNQLPYPLIEGTEYYYIPAIKFGSFVLSTKRYPQSISDLIDIRTLGVGILSIKRGETFYPGATIKVNSSYSSRNNGVFYINKTIDYGSYVRINVAQRVPNISPSWLLYDGNMSIISDGWDYPYYCPLVQADDLYTDVFIHEQLWFQFDDIRHDYITANPIEMSDTVVLSSSPGYQVLLTGFDTQLYDIGNMDENIDTV